MYSQIYFPALIVCCCGFVSIIYCPNLVNIVIKFLDVFRNPNYFKESDIIQNISEQHISSVWCLQRLDGSKMCKFKNLFYLPNYKEHFFFYLSERSILSGVESPEDLKGISLSTIKNHSSLCLKLVVIKSLQHFLEKNTLVFNNDVFIMQRFKPDNIMHLIHDDLLPLYLTYQELCNGNISKCVTEYQLVFSDDNNEGPYYEWYRVFSNKIPIILAKQGNAICFTSSIIGLSQESVWFQYGFKSVHGPVVNPKFNGLRIKDFAKFMKHRLGIEQNTEKVVSADEDHPLSIIFLSRKINRKILNENQVETGIKKSYKKVNGKDVNIYNIDLSLHNSTYIISLLQKSHILIGMHGSGMILSLFLPEGSIILELFPFGIQPEFVSYVKSMCSIQGVFYHYKQWKNIEESNTKTHPEYAPLHGGILHLPLTMQQEIINTKTVPPITCCHNPLYLFRMFQDTIIDQSFYKYFEEIITYHNPSFYKIHIANKIESIVDSWYLPPPVFNLSCKCIENTLIVSWKSPFKDDHTKYLKFSLATSSGIFKITKILEVFIFVEDCKLEKSNTSVWVKALYKENEGLDSYTQCL